MYPEDSNIGIWDGTQRLPTAGGRSTTSSLSHCRGFPPPQQQQQHVDRRPVSSTSHQYQQNRQPYGTHLNQSQRLSGSTGHPNLHQPREIPQQQRQQQQQQLPSQHPDQRQAAPPSLLSCTCCRKPLKGQVWMPTCCKRCVLCDNCAQDKFGTANPRCPACATAVTDDTIWDLAVKPIDSTQQTSLAFLTSAYQPLFVKTNRTNGANLTTKDLCLRQMRQFTKLKQATQFVVSSMLRENKIVTAQRNHAAQQFKKLRDAQAQTIQQLNKAKADMKLMKQKYDLSEQRHKERDNVDQEKDRIIQNYQNAARKHSTGATVTGYPPSGPSRSARSHTSGSNQSYPPNENFAVDVAQNVYGSHPLDSKSPYGRPTNNYTSKSYSQPSKGRLSLSMYQGAETLGQVAGSKRTYQSSGQWNNSGGTKKRPRMETPEDTAMMQSSNPYSRTPDQIYHRQPQQQPATRQQQQPHQQSHPRQYNGNPYSTSRHR